MLMFHQPRILYFAFSSKIRCSFFEFFFRFVGVLCHELLLNLLGNFERKQLVRASFDAIFEITKRLAASLF
jgi:hypothetical protein